MHLQQKLRQLAESSITQSDRSYLPSAQRIRNRHARIEPGEYNRAQP